MILELPEHSERQTDAVARIIQLQLKLQELKVSAEQPSVEGTRADWLRQEATHKGRERHGLSHSTCRLLYQSDLNWPVLGHVLTHWNKWVS